MKLVENKLIPLLMFTVKHNRQTPHILAPVFCIPGSPVGVLNIRQLTMAVTGINSVNSTFQISVKDIAFPFPSASNKHPLTLSCSIRETACWFLS